MLLSLAIRNLWRNTRRTLLTMTAIAAGLALMVFTVNMQTGSYATMVESATQASTGHVVVQHTSYVRTPEAVDVVPNSDQIAEALTAALPNAVVTQRMNVDGLLTSAGGAVGATVRGLQPALERDIDLVPDRIVEGEWLEDDDNRGIILGELLANTLEVELGDRVVYQGNHDGVDTSKLLRVRAIFRTGAADIDGFMAVVSLQAAQELLGKEQANQITMHLPDPRGTERTAVIARETVGELPEGIEVMTWRQAQPSLVDGIQMDRISGDVMLAFLGLIVALGIVNTVLMSVMERVREFGVLMAIGVRPFRIAMLVMLESLVLGIASALVGLALGIALSYPFIVNGLDFAALSGGPMTSSGALIDGLIYFVVDPVRVGTYVIATVAVTVIAGIYPAWTVLRLKPVEAMRSV